MMTAGAGAVLNIVLNFAFIPVMGPYGAAIATAASFVVVFIIRAINTKKFVVIKINYLTFLPSVIMLFAASALMIFEVGGQWISFAVAAVLGVLVILLNIKSIIVIVPLVLNRFIKSANLNAAIEYCAFLVYN